VKISAQQRRPTNEAMMVFLLLFLCLPVVLRSASDRVRVGWDVAEEPDARNS
jgi:hypothetical protein